MRVCAIIYLAAFVLAATYLLIGGANAGQDGEISAVEMRQDCRGLEAAKLRGDLVSMDTARYPEVLICWGAFNALHLEGLRVSENGSGIFLPDVCLVTDGHGQKAVVMMRVFTKYVDSHPEEGGKDFISIVWEAFKQAWPCPPH